MTNSNWKGVLAGLAILLALALLLGALLPSTTLAGPSAQGTETATVTGGGGATETATAMASETATTGGGTTLPTTGAVATNAGSFVLVIGLAGFALLGAGVVLSKVSKK